ncbi:MAG: RecX family transcriptional regulator [Bacteroidales bacterium]|nr:RecX family transcriptional regulator [Bacteroidales bacterium]
MNTPQSLTEDQLRSKAALFCAREEQCRFSVRKKLKDWGASDKIADRVVDWLCEERYIDEHRYVKAYCESKIRYQHWGHIKIEYQLRTKMIHRDLIAEGLAAVPMDEYYAIMRHVAEEKFRRMKGEGSEVCAKLAAFLCTRGFESEASYRVARELTRGMADVD